MAAASMSPSISSSITLDISDEEFLPPRSSQPTTVPAEEQDKIAPWLEEPEPIWLRGGFRELRAAYSFCAKTYLYPQRMPSRKTILCGMVEHRATRAMRMLQLFHQKPCLQGAFESLDAASRSRL
ncbi:hypothetical protein EIP86_001690 [Pleurotus ostreatoroseus]|nr:hypothetical protein EIP86_001690 [Pleurotus ostreatoroseus]